MATKRKVSDMLKRALTGLALIFLGFLPFVKGSERFSDSNLPYDNVAALIASFKENCPSHQDTLSCLYWASREATDIQSSNALRSKQTEERIEETKMRENEFPEENFKETLIELPENHLHKRFLGQRRKIPTARGYKRGPGFRSWGGKRVSMLPGQNFDLKNKFEPLEGKRDEEYFPNDLPMSDPEEWNNKRAKFGSWGGKRSSALSDSATKRSSIWKDRGFYLNEPFIKNVPKRPQFQSWGGKRAMYPWRKIFSFISSQPSRYTISGGEKRKFSSWGGKRCEKNGNDQIGEVFQNWRSKGQSSEEESEEKEPSSSKESDMNETNKITAGNSGRENEESPSTSFAYDGKGTEGSNRR